jgi:hypothetical protein
MNLGIILVAVCLVLGLGAAGALLWVAANAMLHGRSPAEELAMTVSKLRRALHTIYDETAGESLPDEFVDLLGKLTKDGLRAQNISTQQNAVDEPIVAIGLLTETQMRMLGAHSYVWPVADASCATELLEAIDQARRGAWRKPDRAAANT